MLLIGRIPEEMQLSLLRVLYRNSSKYVIIDYLAPLACSMEGVGTLSRWAQLALRSLSSNIVNDSMTDVEAKHGFAHLILSGILRRD